MWSYHHIIEYGHATESANMRDLSPSSVTRDGIAWLKSYMASPSLCRVANDGVNDGVYVGADDGVKDGVYVGADDGVDDGVYVGAVDGIKDGVYVGADDGINDGVYVGADDGIDDGVNVGADEDGIRVGDADGVSVGGQRVAVTLVVP